MATKPKNKKSKSKAGGGTARNNAMTQEERMSALLLLAQSQKRERNGNTRNSILRRWSILIVIVALIWKYLTTPARYISIFELAGDATLETDATISDADVPEMASLLEVAQGRRPIITRIAASPARNMRDLSFTAWAKRAGTGSTLDEEMRAKTLPEDTLVSSRPTIMLVYDQAYRERLRNTTSPFAFLNYGYRSNETMGHFFDEANALMAEDADDDADKQRSEYIYCAGRMSSMFPDTDVEEWQSAFVMPRLDNANSKEKKGTKPQADPEDPKGFASDASYTYIFSSAGTLMQLHDDDAHNFLFQLHGHKDFLLFPPDVCDSFLQMPVTHSMGGVSTINDLTKIDMNEPGNANVLRAKGKGLLLKLKPGDVAYIPPLWCHFVRARTTSVSMQVWSSASEHTTGGARYKKDKISEYLKAYIDLPFTNDQPPALRAKLASTYACFILGASHAKGSAASAIRNYAINWEHTPKRVTDLDPEEESQIDETIQLSPCCTLISADNSQLEEDDDYDQQDTDLAQQESRLQDASMRVVNMIRNAFPDLQKRLTSDYVDFVFTQAFGSVSKARTGVLLWASECAAPGQEHVVFNSVDQ